MATAVGKDVRVDPPVALALGKDTALGKGRGVGMGKLVAVTNPVEQAVVVGGVGDRVLISHPGLSVPPPPRTAPSPAAPAAAAAIDPVGIKDGVERKGGEGEDWVEVVALQVAHVGVGVRVGKEDTVPLL